MCAWGPVKPGEERKPWVIEGCMNMSVNAGLKNRGAKCSAQEVEIIYHIPQSCVNAWTGSAMHAGANAKAGIELLFAYIRSLHVYALWYI